jgi:hypothetical protein
VVGRWTAHDTRKPLVVAGALVTLAACGTGASVTVGAPPVVSIATSSAPAPSGSAPAPVAVCSLLTDAELVPIFPTGAPPSHGNNYGEGFADCAWDDGTAEVLVSVMPRTNLETDYVEQFVVTGKAEAPGLGDEAVRFPGVVGIGKASSGGGSVGFTKGERGVIVAVRTADDAVALEQAITLAMTVASRL